MAVVELVVVVVNSGSISSRFSNSSSNSGSSNTGNGSMVVSYGGSDYC